MIFIEPLYFPQMHRWRADIIFVPYDWLRASLAAYTAMLEREAASYYLRRARDDAADYKAVLSLIKFH